MTADAGQRIDKWLFYARFFKTRTAAAKFVAAGKVRRQSIGAPQRVVKASQTLHVNDILTFALGPRVRVVRLLARGDRRGPPSEAAALYEDLSPPVALAREPGAGRPTKRQRRQLDRLRRPPL